MFGKFAPLFLVESSSLDEMREDVRGNCATSGYFAHMANRNTAPCGNIFEVVRGKEAREVLESFPYIVGEHRRVNAFFVYGIISRSPELREEYACHPLAESDSLRLARVEDEVIKAGLVDYGNALLTPKGVGNGYSLFVVVEVGNSIPVIGDFKNFANFGCDEERLPSLFGDSNETLAELETALLGERETIKILHKCFGYEQCGTIEKRCATSRCSDSKTSHPRPLRPQNGVSTPQMLQLTGTATQYMIGVALNAARYVLDVSAAKVVKKIEKSKDFMQIFREGAINSFIRNYSPMSRTVNHVPDEVNVMNETVAEDEDGVLIHEAVAHFEEPGAVGG